MVKGARRNPLPTRIFVRTKMRVRVDRSDNIAVAGYCGIVVGDNLASAVPLRLERQRP